MDMSREKPPLSREERAEKRRLKVILNAAKPRYLESFGTPLTQTRLGQLVGEMIRGEPMGQGAIWQYTSEKSDTKLNAPVVQAIAAIAGFDPSEVSPRFAPREYVRSAILAHSPDELGALIGDLSDQQIIDAITRWTESLPPKLSMKLAQIFLARASAEL